VATGPLRAPLQRIFALAARVGGGDGQQGRSPRAPCRRATGVAEVAVGNLGWER
jgi:hypothetical protein